MPATLLSVIRGLWLVELYVIQCIPSRCQFGLAISVCDSTFVLLNMADVLRAAFSLRAVLMELDLMVHSFEFLLNLL